MDIQKLIETLHPLERKVISVFSKTTDFDKVVELSGLQEVEVMRALQWMQNKQIINLKEELKDIAELEENGKKYIEKGLPEINFLKAVKEKKISFSEIKKKTALNEGELTSSIGILKSKLAINVEKEKELVFSITEIGKKMLEKESLEELFLKKKFPIEIKNLKPEEKFALDSLLKRKNIVKTKLLKLKKIELTETAKKIVKKGVSGIKLADRLTPEMLKTDEWIKTKFRRFDVKINVPAVFGGRKQHYRRFQDDVRKKFLSLGFSEMDGPIVETDFWDMDALFMPQFHSARDIHNAYYIKEPALGELDRIIVDRVKKAHEDGFGTGSRGWQYKFDAERTRRHLLRTQGTACSARMLASPELKIPGKYFALVRCFRYDVVDATHNSDFFQTEGIVVEKDLTIKHLFGLLQMFAKEFADTDEIKLVPGYFPFTEPSVELFAKHPVLGWIELGGAGIFRPEMVKPLTGRDDLSVIAWGLGIDRIGMFKLGIKDIRDLFSRDLNFLRKTKVI